MDLIWIIVVVAVIWGIASGLVKLREAAGKGIHRAIRPGAYQKGKELAGREGSSPAEWCSGSFV